MFIKQFQERMFMVFSYLVSCPESKEALVIDPAGDPEPILAEVAEHGWQLTQIVNTHTHVDHIMGNAEVKERTGARIIVHEDDAESLVNISPYKLSMFDARPSPPADGTVRDGDIIRAGSLELRVIHTPGHSPGSMCLLLDGYLFTGDTLFVQGVGRTDLAGGSWEQLLQSITGRIFSLPEETVILPGHHYGPRPTSTVKDEKQYNPFVR